MALRYELSALIERHLGERPDDVALVAGDRRVTFAELDALCDATAAWLAEQGIGPGDRVAVWLVNRIEWLALLFGLARIGAAMVAVNTRYRSSELQYILDRSGARMLVLQPGFGKIDFPAVLRGLDANALPALERVAVVEAQGRPEAILGKATVAFRLDAAEAAPNGADAEALAILFTTSGTTSGPKLVMHPQRTLAAHARCNARFLGLEAPDARLLAALPLCGTFGLSGALAALAAGAPVILMETFEAEEAAALVRAHRITHVFGSDEMFRRMAEAVNGYDPFPSLRVAGFASFNPGAAELARAAWARRIPLLGLYGSSEVQALFAMQSADLPLDQRIEPGGRPSAGMGADVRVRDIASGELLPPGESGEIEIRGPSLFTGYLNNPQATAAAMREDGFFRTGDIGWIREDLTFVYETRGGDALRLGGYLVSPFEIEDTLKGIAGVADAQVVGVEIGAQSRCVAFIIPAGAVQEQEVIADARALMAGYKVPARVFFVDEFPITQSANGAKIQRAKLREMAMERLRRNAVDGTK